MSIIDKLRDKQGTAPAPTPPPTAPKAAKPKRLPKKEYQEAQHKAFDQSQRLPHGSVFTLIYDATKVEWTGSLAIGEAGNPVFAATTSGAIQMLKHLDAFWRAHLAAQQTEEKPS